jgi:hypothetical protein
MTEIRLSLTAPAADLLAVSTALLNRATWARRRWLLLAFPIPLAAGFGLGMAWMSGVPVPDAALIVIYTLLGGMLGLIIANRLQTRQYERLFATSTLRAVACPVILSDTGLRFEARDLPWSAITGTSRWRDATLVHFSSVDALVIPDHDLPAGVTESAITAAIATWRMA